MEKDMELMSTFGKKIVVPNFVYGTKNLDRGPLVGICRGYGPIMDEENEDQLSIGIFTDKGIYYNIIIDTSVMRSTPQFVLDDQTFFYSIVGCYTMNHGKPCIDTKTGYLLPN